MKNKDKYNENIEKKSYHVVLLIRPKKNRRYDMASGISVMVKALDIKKMHVDRVTMSEKTVTHDGIQTTQRQIHMYVKPYKCISGECPECRKKCSGYDQKREEPSTWRANSLNGVPVFLHYAPKRIKCPKHGVKTEFLPWADGTSRFTKGFNNDIAFMALNTPKTVVSQYMDINWRTVGNALKAAHDRIEPDVSVRLRGLRKICVDETSREKGHTYITVVYDMDRNQVAWVHDGYGQEIFKLFCESLTKEEQEAIEVVAGDGARWIDQCVKEYFKNAKRCVDFFHVVGWTNDALDKVRLGAQRQAARDVNKMQEELIRQEKEEAEQKAEILKECHRAEKEIKAMHSKGRPSKKKKELQAYLESLYKQLEDMDVHVQREVSEDEYIAAKDELATLSKRGRPSKRKIELIAIIAAYEGVESSHKKKGKLSAEHQAIIDCLKKKADDIKGTKYALGMNPENLTDSMKDKLKLLEGSFPEVYRAHRYKEQLRIILHMKDVKTAEAELDKWIDETRQCGINPFEELSEKIARHRDNILNSVALQVNSSKSEATNTTIKALIKMARGFRNLDNMFALIYLRCSDLVIPLNNRYQPSAETQQYLREISNDRRKKREEERRQAAMQA